MPPDIAAAARRLAAHARYATGDMRPVQSADLVALLPYHEALVAGQDDAGRVERWARQLCAGDGLNPDQDWSCARTSPSQPSPLLAWRAYEHKARAAIALADAERAAKVAEDQQSANESPWSRAMLSEHAGLCMCHSCIRDRSEAPVTLHVCPECGNKRCPRASDHRLACTGSNAVGQPGSVF